jgi:hypothetical protein
MPIGPNGRVVMVEFTSSCFHSRDKKFRQGHGRVHFCADRWRQPSGAGRSSRLAGLSATAGRLWPRRRVGLGQPGEERRGGPVQLGKIAGLVLVYWAKSSIE